MLTAADLESIRCLMFRYAFYVDEREHGLLGDMFALGAIKSNKGEVGKGLVGADAVRQAYDRNNKVMPNGTAGTKHLVTNVSIDPHQSRDAPVLSTSVFSVYQATDRLPLQPIVMGRYEDQFILGAGRWRFAEKKIVVDLIGDLSDHLTITL